MISALFGEMTSIASAFVTFLTGLFESLVSIFWTEGVGETPGSLTFMGTFLLIGVVTGIVIWGLHFLKNLITRVRTK